MLYRQSIDSKTLSFECEIHRLKHFEKHPGLLNILGFNTKGKNNFN